jgi:NAD(P)-dependent dehydrogenase (short-subunit alcohol dehydrogenase family)
VTFPDIESVCNDLTGHAVYSAAKGYVHGLTTGLAREFAGQGITVSVVAPSYTRTPNSTRPWPRAAPRSGSARSSATPSA